MFSFAGSNYTHQNIMLFLKLSLKTKDVFYVLLFIFIYKSTGQWEIGNTKDLTFTTYRQRIKDMLPPIKVCPSPGQVCLFPMNLCQFCFFDVVVLCFCFVLFVVIEIEPRPCTCKTSTSNWAISPALCQLFLYINFT